jgi:TolB-like protein/DNA-binding winged helix-turn-helix (wHTH) protein/tetratricopeptide (TPR) repeat protein
MPPSPPRVVVVDDLVIDFAARRLLREGCEQALEPKAFAVLALLASSAGQVVSREEILDAVWGHRHVTPGVLNRITSLLRQALGEDAQHPRLLHTIYGIGYRLDLPGQPPPGQPAPAPAGPAEPPATSAAPPTDLPRPASLPEAGGLRRRLPLLGLLMLGLAGLAWLLHQAPDPAPRAVVDDASLAVLPFADLSPGADQRYFADGLAEEILGQLAQAPALRVVGRASSFSLQGAGASPQAIGRSLGVSHLLSGSVRRDGPRLRVSAELLRAEDGTRVWSRVYARELRDVFAVQEEIARDVAQAMSVKLDVATFSRGQGGTTDVDAYERYLRWRGSQMLELYGLEHRRERLQLAREMVALDPACVLCMDALASSLEAMVPKVDAVQAQRLRAEAAGVREAIARRAPQSWVARRDRSNQLWLQGRRDEAIALAADIAATGPPTKERVWDYAYMIYAMGHLNDTIALVEQVRAVEPASIFLSRDLQFDYTAARRYADAESEYQRGLALPGSQYEPTFVAFFRQLAGQRGGGLEELRALHARLLEAGHHDTPFFRSLGPVLDQPEAMLGRVRQVLEQRGRDGRDAELAMFVADALGDADLAVAAMGLALEQAAGYAEGRMAQERYVVFWNVPYSQARAHPQFKVLLRQAGVVDYWRQTGRWGDGCVPLGVDDFQCR